VRARFKFLGVAVAAGCVFGAGRLAAKVQPKPSDLMETHDTLDRMCGETGSPVAAATACEQRDKIKATIKAQGWCKGRRGQEAADHQWHACGRGSL
jgi:hypothetical protein